MPAPLVLGAAQIAARVAAPVAKQAVDQALARLPSGKT
jgi:hypothetical protein